jgi:archaellum biogenesis ATPase FlaH
MSPIDLVLSKLEGVKPAGSGRWMAKCPSHADGTASLSVHESETGNAVLFCQANCKTETVVGDLELSMTDLFPPKDSANSNRAQIVATYDYRDERGGLLYQAVRLSPKSFRQRKPVAAGGWDWKLEDTRRVLFRLPEIIAAPKDAIVWIAEGEKDVLALANLGLIATTNVGGAGKWKPEYSQFLRGRQVTILPDNDDAGRKHAAQVASALDGIAAGVRVIELPGLPPKGDVSDWLLSGGTAAKLKELAASTSNGVPAAHSFRPSALRLVGEREDRIKNAQGILTFGVPYLDQALGGITGGDLVLLGAKSGVGKTSLATITALANCQAGKRVHYFALEAEEREIERRMKFQIIADMYYSSRMHTVPLRFQDWYNGLLDDELGSLEAEADRRLAAVLANLSTYYRTESFTSADFREQFEAITKETDLVILDHFHYIDDDERDRDENKGAKNSVKQIRDCVLRARKPVIVVAHVRKADRRNDTLVPTLEDFHGSSDIPKIATKAIMIAPAYDVPGSASFLWPTYIMAAKCRTDMSVTRYASLLSYNTRQNNYEPDYVLGRLTDGGRLFSELPPSELPFWARATNRQEDQLADEIRA